MLSLRTAVLSAALAVGATLANAADLILKPAHTDQRGTHQRPRHDTGTLKPPAPGLLYEQFIEWLKRR
jgi:hypothetical protein